MSFPKSIHLFCRVVDNFGDIGVCWRLARQFTNEHEIDVAIWVDDLSSFGKICTAINPRREVQIVEGVKVMHWRKDLLTFNGVANVDSVIEAFGCELPSAYIAAMAARNRKPAWINLEYLSAENWVESCHAMQSLYPSLPLTKYFFFPGFSDKTGGLLMERDVIVHRNDFQESPNASYRFLESIGVDSIREVRKISLFCYPTAPVTALFDVLQNDVRPTICMVPQGVAFNAVSTFIRQPAVPGAAATRGGLTVKVVPFLDQPDYDRLLWACDLNFVRGEDSLVRAHWAGRPFVWHIYPQEEGTHLIKLDAFLDRYTSQMQSHMRQAVVAAWHAWNGKGDFQIEWPPFRTTMPQLAPYMVDWTRKLQKNGNLAANLLEFIRKVG